MARAFTRILSDDAVAAGLPGAKPSVAIGAGMQRCIKLNVSSEGRLTDFSVQQHAAETQVAFSVELLKSALPYLPDTDQAAGTAPAVLLTHYRVIDPMEVAAGQPAETIAQNIGYNFRNLDGGYANNQTYLYLLIVPEGAGGVTTWEASLTIERD